MARRQGSRDCDSVSCGLQTGGARFATFRETLAPLVGLDFRTVGDAEPAFAATIRDLPAIPVFTIAGRALAMERTKALIAADGKVGFALSIVRHGAAQIVQQGRTVEIGSGAATLTTGAEPVSLNFAADVDALTIMPSRAPLAALVPDLDDRVARSIPADGDALRLLAGYADMVHRHPPGTPALQQMVAAHLFDLTALAIGASGDAAVLAQGRGARAARLAALKRDIGEMLTEPGLSIGALAARHRISPRYVAALFADEHTSFSDFVRGQRLERAYRLLVNPLHARRSISELAYACGFNDLSYFNRCFRARYGTPPGALRREARNRVGAETPRV